MKHEFFGNCIICMGVSIFIITALSSSLVGLILGSQVPRFLGKISYSLYLFHVLCLVLMIDIFYDRISLALIWPLALMLTLIVSSLTYCYVEAPGIALGKYLSNRWFGTRKSTMVDLKTPGD